MTDAPCIPYYSMGAWPLYVGFTMSPKAFRREMKRLKISPPPPMVNARANATMHTLEKGGATTCIIAMQKPEGRSVEQVAGMIAHEAVHVAQELWSAIGESRPGREAEAYLVQQIVQCCMQDALNTGRTRKETP